VHLARRSYLFIVLTAVIAIGGIWSSDRQLALLWRVPAALLLLGLAFEGVVVRRMQPLARIDTPTPAFLGRLQRGAFVFTNSASRPLTLEYAPAMPAGFEAPRVVRRLTVPARAAREDALELLPVRLGPQPWPGAPGPPARSAGARLVGRHAAAAGALPGST
jgi:hypothetical protein